MKNKLVFKLVNPEITSWEKFITLEEKIIVLCKTFNVRVFDHLNDQTNFTQIVYVEFEDTNAIINCIFQVAHFLDSENLEFELVERIEIDAKLKEIGNLPLFKVNKLIDQLNKGLEKLRNIG